MSGHPPGSKQPQNKVCLITASSSRKVGDRCCLQPIVQTKANPTFPAHSVSNLLVVMGALPSKLQGSSAQGGGNMLSFQM